MYSPEANRLKVEHVTSKYSRNVEIGPAFISYSSSHEDMKRRLQAKNDRRLSYPAERLWTVASRYFVALI